MLLSVFMLLGLCAGGLRKRFSTNFFDTVMSGDPSALDQYDAKQLMEHAKEMQEFGILQKGIN